ncbi:quinoprotein dehydrogenase-associated SoxYZ-like carrier [Salipiger marinus]|uniref:Sulfur-oxidizing protein SoxY n=1 Tax=Salipiger marinus TaxID=555512 RepID=A0A1G8SF41_9RHOB|nr:quinoprotein dehydrogenase-associated SoxYZ-like carrier [Salipiger marinus]SDJ27310.1 sulfur-oxidizing protein SoxY [Salipiger marinus]
MKRFCLAVALLAAGPVMAEDPVWPGIAAQLYGDRPLRDGASVIAIDAPYRSANDARTQIAAQVVAPDGLQIGQIALVLDNNPMPVSAVLALAEPQARVFVDVTLRVNGPTPLHVVAETSDGQLWVAESFVKTSGLGACSAPPGTDPELALATLGQIEISAGGPLPGDATARLSALTSGAAAQKRLDVALSHPSHSGMQMDQVTLLFTPMRYVEQVQIDLDGAPYATVTGSISLSENPAVSLSVPRATRQVAVTMQDTDGTVSRAQKDLTEF